MRYTPLLEAEVVAEVCKHFLHTHLVFPVDDRGYTSFISFQKMGFFNDFIQFQSAYHAVYRGAPPRTEIGTQREEHFSSLSPTPSFSGRGRCGGIGCAT
jgi:hypothetical protein